MGSSVSFILGPTAAGKSEVAHRLAVESGAVVLCMDSMQVYRELELGVGKPSVEERKEVVYGGLDLVDLDQEFDVVSYLREAERFLREAERNQKPVVIVGGTGLYFRALTRGFSAVPEIDPEIREGLEKLSLGELQEELRRLDPEMVARLDFQNPRRLIRALEVKKGTGVSLGEWQKRNEPALIPEFHAYFLHPGDLKERIERRAIEMARRGWREEVRGRLETGGEERVRGVAAIGYDLWTDVLQGKISESEAVTRIQQETWQYARRQLTWFRKEPKYQRLNFSADTPLSLVTESIRHSQRSTPPFTPIDPSTPEIQKMQDISCS
jgi:tRNA dimethylallyltransferase